MPINKFRRKLKQHRASSAAKLSVRAHIPAWLKFSIGALLLGLIGMMIWGGYDAGRLFAGFNSSKVAEEREILIKERDHLRNENEVLRKHNTELESDFQIAQGARKTLSEQIVGLQTQLTQLKEDVAFMQKLNTGAVKESGVSIQRMQMDADGGSAYRYRIMLAQNTTQANEFKGNLQLLISVEHNGKRQNLVVPDEQADLTNNFKVNFKTFQRLEGSFRVPTGATLKSVQAKLFAQGNSSAKAQSTVQW
ncbi:MAG: hypothetical protein RLZZ502_1637 [Pseudomonadota bacterium]